MTDRPALFFAHANFDGDESRCSCTALGPGPHTREQIPAYEQGRRLRVPTGIRETGTSPPVREEEIEVTTSPSSSAMGDGLPTARSRAGEDLTMADQHDGATRQSYILARLEAADGREWFSLHLTSEDAERQLKAVGDAWGVGFTPDGEPAGGFRRYGAEEVAVLGPDESGEPPEESSEVTLTDEETRTWMWLIARGVPGGLSAEEMADELGITNEVAALRLVSLTAMELAHEVSPGRYRPGSKYD